MCVAVCATIILGIRWVDWIGAAALQDWRKNSGNVFCSTLKNFKPTFPKLMKQLRQQKAQQHIKEEQPQQQHVYQWMSRCEPVVTLCQ